MSSNCLDYKSSELQKLAIDVGLEESNPAFADKIGTLMDSLGIDDESLPTVEQVIEYMASNKPNEDIVLSDNEVKIKSPQGLAYMECWLPATYEELFDERFRNEDGDVDFDRVNEVLPEIMDMVGFRIPTEDKYSVMPLKATKFLPSGSGGAIMLPSEITTIAGLDRR